MTAHGYDGGQSQKAIDWLSNAARPEMWRLAGAAIFGSVGHVFAIILAAATGLLIARATGQSPILYLTIALVAVRGFGLGSAALRYAAEVFGQDAGFRVMSRTRVQVYVDLERAGPSGTGRLRGGDLLVRVMNDVEAVHSLLVKGILPMVVATLTGLAAMIGLGILLPLAGVVLLLGIVIAGIAAPMASMAAAGAAERRLGPAREDLAAPTVELLSGAAELKAFRASDRWMERIHACDTTLTRLAKRTAAGSGIGSGIAMLALGLTVVLELVVGLASGVPGWWLPILILVPVTVFEITTGIPAAAQQVRHGVDAAARLQQLEELPRPPAAGGTIPLPDGPLRLDVDDLSVRWPGEAVSALKGVTFDLRPGRRIAIVGESGAGKTTLVTAILGFLPAETGQVLLGGTDLADVDEEALRSAVAVCAQDAHIFDTTIRNNLLLARPEATLHEMANALRKARMWEWVEGLPLGLDTPVGERGVRLSGGERQRLTLARSLLADPRVLLLDEPTAHLDEPTAAALMRDLLVATAGRTTLLVTHRLAGLSVVDEILVLADGLVVQRGTPTELMESPGPYRKMWFRSAAAASSLTGLPVR